MSGTYVDRWFADPQLDLSFHLEDASTAEWTSAGTESQKRAPRLSVGKRGTFGQPVFVDVPMANPRRSSRVPNLNEKYQREQIERPRSEERDSRGSYDRPPVPSKQPTGQFQTVDITPDKRNSTLAPRRSPNQRQSALLTIAEFETSPTRPLSTYSYSSQATSYTPQTKPPQQYKPPSSTVSSAVSSVSTQRSTTSSNTTLDYSLFSLPVNGLQYTGGGGGQRRENPQPRPEQYIQQSARRPMNRGNNSPRQSSFNASQRGQKVFRVNSRGANRRGSIRKQQYGPGKPKAVGDIRAIPTCTVGAQRIHVVRPSERPHIVGIPPPHRHPASRKSQYPVIQTTIPTEFPVPAIISITPPSATTPEPQELPVTSSPQELCAGEFGFPPVVGSDQVSKSTTPPPPAYTPPPPPPPSCAPPPPPPPAYTAYRTKTPEPRGAPVSPPVSPPASPPRSQENLRQMLISTSKPLPSIPPLVTGWPSWGKEEKDETTEKKDVVKVVAPPSPAETSWDPAGWKDEEVPKKEEVKAVAKEEEKVSKKEELKIIAKEEKQKVAPKEEPKAEAEKDKVEPRKMPEIPEALRIGNKQNSSLFQRLSSLETMDIPSRY